MFDGEMDSSDAYLDIQSGAGGTEAQGLGRNDFKDVSKVVESHEFKTEIIEISSGDVAGIKSATVHIKGEYAYGWLRSETGVHRLVRKSPFDSGNKRHTLCICFCYA